MDINVNRTLLYGILTLLILMWLRWRRKKLQIFKNLGIPGPKPNFLFGNILELNRKGPVRCHKEWMQKYGNIVGFYHGMKPILLVANPDLLKKIFIKDFNLFSDRPENVPTRVHSFLDPIIPASDIMDNITTNLKGKKWKEIRSILTPVFSAAKLKMMLPAVNDVTNITLSILEKKSEDEVNILEILQRLTLDLICAQAFAMNVDSQRDPDSLLLKSAKVIFDLAYDSKIIFFGNCFPELEFFAMATNFLRMFIRNNGYIPPLEITQVVGEAVEKRRNDPSMRRLDLLQLMIDASAKPTDTVNQNRDPEAIEQESFKRKLKLNDLEIKSNALVVFLAGYETTSAALAYSFHFLSIYPNIQRQLQEEIDEAFKNKAELDYSSLSNLRSLERFILESMRLYPPAMNFVTRIATTDVDYEYIRIPKGMQIVVPVHYIHHSEEFFESPEEFNIDRFCSKNITEHRSVSYWSFGVGPRKCIGTRLATLTSKIIIAKVLREFNILPIKTPKELKSDIKVNTIVPTEVLIQLERRNFANTY